MIRRGDYREYDILCIYCHSLVRYNEFELKKDEAEQWCNFRCPVCNNTQSIHVSQMKIVKETDLQINSYGK